MMKLCRTELTEIETCSECYYNANTNTSWFVEACERPHLLVWAKLKGFPFWPAKAMSINGTQVDVRFFGEHDRAWIPNTACLLYSVKDPNPISKSRKNNISECIREVDRHIEKLKEKFGAFNYAEFRSPLELNLEQEYVKNMLPNLRKAALKTENKSKSLTLKFVKQPGLATKNDATKIYQVMNNNGDESEQVRSMILKRKDNWKSVPVQAEEEEETVTVPNVPIVQKKGKSKISTVVGLKDEQRASTSKETDNTSKFQRVYSAASSLLQNVESKKITLKRRKSTRLTIDPPPEFESNGIEKTIPESDKAPEGRKINAHSRKTRSKSGPLEPLEEPPPKSARMAARLKTLKPTNTEVAATPIDPEFSLKGVKGRLKTRLKSLKMVAHPEVENQVEEEKSIKIRRMGVESEALVEMIIKQEPLSDDENSINENQINRSDPKDITQMPSANFTNNSAVLELPTQRPLHQLPVARKARKTFPKKLPIPIMPSVTVQSAVLDLMTNINSMVCIPSPQSQSKSNPSKSSEIPPLVAMGQPSTSSSSSSSLKFKTLTNLKNRKSIDLDPVPTMNGGDSFQKSSILPNMSTGLASAIAETIIGSIPPKLTPRPSHPSRSDGSTFHRDCGPVTRTLNDTAHSMTDFFRKLIVDVLSGISSIHPEAKIHALQAQIEELHARHKREITDLQRNTGEILNNL